MGRRFKRMKPGKRRAQLKRWPSSIPLANGPVAFREYVSRTRKINTQEAIAETTKHQRLWQTDRRQGIRTFNSIVLTNGRFEKVRLFFCGQVHFFRKELKLTGMVQNSIEYGSHEEAMRAYDELGVQYKRPEPAPPETE